MPRRGGNVIVVGVPELRNRIRELKKAPRDVLREVVEDAVERARATAPVKTGKTRDSIRVGQITNTYGTIRAGGAALYIEKGTEPHIIRPRRRKALRFEVDGNLVFAKQVHHPGTVANPFIEEAVADAVDNVEVDAMIRAWNRGA